MHPLEASLQAQLAAFKAFKVKHPRLEEMDRDLMRAISGHRSYTRLSVYGASGVGKSTVMKRVAERCREEEPNPAVVPAAVVQASPEDIGTSARLVDFRQILDQLRGHVGVRDRVMNLALARSPEKKSRDPAAWLDMREAVVYALELLRVKVVFVDEAQHLMYVNTPHKPTAQLDWLKALTNRTNILHVLVGNLDLYDFCHLNAQAARRMRDLPFSRYYLDNQTECEEFVGALRLLLERVPLSVDVLGLLSHWRWFGEWSLGCILANPTTLAISQGTPAFGNGASAMTATPEVAGRTRTRSRIEREAFRDPVGDQIQVVNALKCSFSGVLSIELKQFLDSGSRLFECPECARMRSLSPHNGVLRFPSHDKRKRRTPNTDPRWVMHEMSWELVEGESKL